MRLKQLQIPAPCLQDWESMTATDCGRHCAKCDKVVRDFSGLSQPEILEELAGISDQVCGRVDAKALHPATVPFPLLAKFPAERIRLFLVAFVVVFGLEVWGIPVAEAQTVQSAVDSLKLVGNLISAIQDSSREWHLKGKVEDVYTREPVAYAMVAVYEGEHFIQGTTTEEDGTFDLTVTKDSLHLATFDLHLSYLGKIRKDVGISSDHREFLYLIDASRMMDGIIIADEEYMQLTGVVMITRYGVENKFYPDGDLYRPLDEWLMMHNSEIHHNGRW